jgi:hypothetical protein
MTRQPAVVSPTGCPEDHQARVRRRGSGALRLSGPLGSRYELVRQEIWHKGKFRGTCVPLKPSFVRHTESTSVPRARAALAELC